MTKRLERVKDLLIKGGSTKHANILDEAVNEDKTVFLIPFIDTHLLYAPLTGLVALIDIAGAKTVQKHYSGKALSNEDDYTMKKLKQAGFFSNPTEKAFRPHQKAVMWEPTTVTFSTTQKCTLRCKYCYAEGGRLGDFDIPIPIARAAIDLIVRNAVKRKKAANINFLGEGEATASWEEFTISINYFKSLCKQNGINGYIELSSNGVFSQNRVEYLAANCTKLTFSVDGVAEVHDKNRILPNGQGSFNLIFQNLQTFDKLGKEYSIRSTVNADAVNRMKDFVVFVGENLRCKQIHFEPVFDVTRVTRISGDIPHPKAQAFVDGFREARKAAALYQIEIYYSGSDIDHIRNSFCGASEARNFLVTSRGIITSCNEVLQEWDPRASIFQYGNWNSEKNMFDLKESNIYRLNRLDVDEIPKCQGCFAKYNCAGDCYARTSGMYGNPWAFEYTYRCYIARELLKDNLMLALLGSTLDIKYSQERGSCAF